MSPRSRSTNTPLKIYQYLRSGKAIVATRLLTHTQVLDDDTAILTGMSPREYADGILASDHRSCAGCHHRQMPSIRRDEVRYGVPGENEARLRRPRSARHTDVARFSGEGRGVSERRDHYSYTCTPTPPTRSRSTPGVSAVPSATSWQPAEADVLASMLGPIQGRRILDVGTGTGRGAFSWLLREPR